VTSPDSGAPDGASGSDRGDGNDASLSDAFAAAARKAGIARVAPGEAPSGRALLAAIGGVRGIVEAILPGLGFLIVYTLTQELLPSVLIPVAVAVVFVAVRLAARSPATSAIAGVVGVGASAVLAIVSGRAEENFLLGFYINGAWAIALVASLATRWPIIGIVVGLLRGEGTAWRGDRAKFRVATITTALWAGLFALRLAVQLPLYFAAQPQLLGATKLVMGLPLYAAMLWITWLLVRAVYASDGTTAGDARPRDSD